VAYVPLAEQLRPKTLEDYVGQTHIVGNDKPLRKLLESGKVPSMILWGPPGSGKTTLARLIANYIDAYFISYSAVTGSISEVRKIISESAKDKGFFNKDTVLFVDEIHRFNKAQQDAFLPHVENGTIILIGATTENPGFSVISPLLSRSRVYTLNPLTNEDLDVIVKRAVNKYPDVKWKKEALEMIKQFAEGDARFAINAVELTSSLEKEISKKHVEEALQKKNLRYDKNGEQHYDVISAFIKSMRGGDPDATLHYLARMISAGEDPVFIARRMVIFASEDIGNIRPTALILATSTMQAVQMIGMPESKIILAQTATYLATCDKSTASYDGINQAISDVENIEVGEVPLHLRNPVNKVMKDLDYGKNHVRYPWKEEQKTGKKIIQEYLPKKLKGKQYYKPNF
jgi:putative ATPase